MPILYELDRGARLIRTRCVGDVKYAEVVEHFRELAALEGLPAGLDVLLDLTGLGSLPDAGQIRGVATEVGLLRGAMDFGVWAVAADQDAVYGMMRMLHVFAEPHVDGIGVFRSLGEAEAWLESARAPLP